MIVEKSKKRLNEITLMRVILAMLIVFMHAFTCYNHAWPAPEGYKDVVIYKWLSRISIAFTLESFVFISGYLFAFQRNSLSYKGNKSLIVNKAKRLLFPCFVFSILYFVAFQLDNNSSGYLSSIYMILNGCGHLWFLPMLFWCFCLALFLIDFWHCNDFILFAILVLLNLLTVDILPFRLSNAFTYLVYFLGGYKAYTYKDYILQIITKQPGKLVLGWAVFFIAFVCLDPLRDLLDVNTANGVFLKALTAIANHACKLVFASIGTVVFFCSALWITNNQPINETVEKLSLYCFGIYIFQQFILQFLYYHTSFPVLVGNYLLPWFGFLIAFILSALLSVMFHQTKVGRFILG